MFGIGNMELLIVGVIALLLFGSRLPNVMRSLGSGLSEFKRGLDDVQREVHRQVSDVSSQVTDVSKHDNETKTK